MKKLKDLSVKNKRVLVRVDFNVPLTEKGEILDDFRIQATLPTIEYLLENQAKIILMSHLDSPQGRVIEELKMDRIQEVLSEYLDLSIVKAPEYYNKEIKRWTYEMKRGEILLLENLRFWPGEEKNSQRFAQNLARLGEIYINDAFASSHREHASIVRVPKFLKEKGIGLLFEKEIQAIKELLDKKERPLIIIVGGIKKSKIEFLESILPKADFILVSGIIAKKLPSSLRRNKKIVNPLDAVVISGIKKTERQEVKPFDQVRKNEFIPDIGPRTQELYSEYIKKARHIFWVGPLGQFEIKNFSYGTETIAKAILENKEAFSVIGGGHLLLALKKLKLRDKGFDHLSTGGGALLRYLSGEKLPGIKALEN